MFNIINIDKLCMSVLKNINYPCLKYGFNINNNTSYFPSTGIKLCSDDVFDLMKPLMKSLTQIYAENIMHINISPDNIILTNKGYVKLLCFKDARDIIADEKDKPLYTDIQIEQEVNRNRASSTIEQAMKNMCQSEPQGNQENISSFNNKPYLKKKYIIIVIGIVCTIIMLIVLFFISNLSY